MKIVKKNGESIWSDKSLIKNPSTRLRFSLWVIVANFILGIIGMLLGSDLTALGVFLGLANAPLYAYILGRSFRPSQIPDSYYNQSHSGSGGLGTILNDETDLESDSSSNSSIPNVIQTQKPDEFNNQNFPQNNNPIPTIKKPTSEVG